MKTLITLIAVSFVFSSVTLGQKQPDKIELTPKQEQRYITPDALFIGLYTGGARMLNKMEGALDHFKNGGFMGQYYGINIEKGIRRNIFVAGAISVLEIWDKRSYEIGVFSGEGGNAFWASQVGIQLGYRVIGPKNYNYFNVAVGIENGFVMDQKGPNGSSGLTITQSNQHEGALYSYKATFDLNHNWYSALSLQLSKDFKLFKGMYLSLACNTQLGLRKFFVTNIDYYTVGNQQSKATSSFMDGTQQQLLLGLKYKF